MRNRSRIPARNLNLLFPESETALGDVAVGVTTIYTNVAKSETRSS